MRRLAENWLDSPHFVLRILNGTVYQGPRRLPDVDGYKPSTRLSKHEADIKANNELSGHLFRLGKHVDTLVKVVSSSQLLPLVGDTRPPLRPLPRRRLATRDPLLFLLLRLFPHLLLPKVWPVNISYALKYKTWRWTRANRDLKSNLDREVGIVLV